MAEILIILILILINGLLAGTEIAVLSVRRPVLASQAEGGDARAKSVLGLLDNTNAFLSTIQVGITLVGILAGAFGGANVVRLLMPYLSKLPIPGLETYGPVVAFAVVVVGITYLTLVLGELAPKRLALSHPERISKVMARPMRYLASITRPVVWILTKSTDAVLRPLGIRHRYQHTVTEEEVRYLVSEGARTGVFVPAESQIVERIFRFADESLTDVMRPRPDIVALDINEPVGAIRDTVLSTGFSRFPVYRGDLSNVVGILHAKDLLDREDSTPLEPLLREGLFVPGTTSLLAMLQTFQTTHSHMAIVINEFGGTEGVVTLEDVLEEIVGEIIDEYDVEEPAVVTRADGSLLVDGSLSLVDLKEILGIDYIQGEETREFHTLGGLVMAMLRRVPREGDTLELLGHSFEVVDMDGLRVDKVLVVPKAED
jgi:putative hemolysin